MNGGVGQAAHWFDHSKVWPQLTKHVRPGGTVAYLVCFPPPPALFMYRPLICTNAPSPPLPALLFSDWIWKFWETGLRRTPLPIAPPPHSSFHSLFLFPSAPRDWALLVPAGEGDCRRAIGSSSISCQTRAGAEAGGGGGGGEGSRETTGDDD